MLTPMPVPNPRPLGAGMLGFGALLALVQAVMVGVFGVYSWEVMVFLFGSAVPGTWLLVMGDEADPETGRVPTWRRVGRIAAFVVGVVLALAVSGLLVHGLGIELWD
jgi:hypothetical protein